MGLLFKGVIIGLAIAAPVGPIGVLCIRRTLAEGRTSGFVSGLGAATADALYGSVAALGLTFVANFLVSGEMWLRLVGGAFLVFLGVRTFLARPAERTRARGSLRLDALPDAHEPRDDPLLRRDLRGPGSGKRRERCPIGYVAGAGRIPRFGPLVVGAERGHEPLSRQAIRRRAAVGQQDFGHRPRDVRPARRLGARGVRLAR